MDSLRGGPATAQIRAGLHRFRCGYRCFPLDCWPNLRENAFQILQRGLWTNSWSRGLRSLCRRSLGTYWGEKWRGGLQCRQCSLVFDPFSLDDRSEEHTSELQSLTNLVCRLLLEKKKTR